MDWYLDTGVTGAASSLRRQIGAQLRRHGSPDSDIDGAELAVSELLSNAERHATGPAWILLDWSDASPVIEVHDLGPGFTLDANASPDNIERIGGRGLLIVDAVAADFSAAAKRAGGTAVRAVLPVTRPVERSFAPGHHFTDPLPHLDQAGESDGFSREPFLLALAVQLSHAVEANA